MKNSRLIVSSAMLVSMASMAQVPQAYVGATGGYARADVDCSGTLSCDRSTPSFLAFAGVMVLPVLGIELQLHDYGKVKASVTGIDAEIRNNGAGLGVLLNWPLSSLADGFVRLGAARNRSKVTLAGTVSGSTTDTVTQAYYGLGASFKMTGNLGFRMQLDGTTFKPSGEKMDANMFSMGFAYRF